MYKTFVFYILWYNWWWNKWILDEAIDYNKERFNKVCKDIYIKRSSDNIEIYSSGYNKFDLDKVNVN